jgi:hypothetical protein
VGLRRLHGWLLLQQLPVHSWGIQGLVWPSEQLHPSGASLHTFAVPAGSYMMQLMLL